MSHIYKYVFCNNSFNLLLFVIDPSIDLKGCFIQIPFFTPKKSGCIRASFEFVSVDSNTSTLSQLYHFRAKLKTFLDNR